MDEEGWAGAEELLREWLARTRINQHSHHEAGKSGRILYYWLTVPVILITTTIGTMALATIKSPTMGSSKIVLGALSLFAAVLSALQAHLRFSEKSEKHRQLGAQYGNIGRDIESLLALPPRQREPLSTALARIREKLDNISPEGEVVSPKIFERTRRTLERNAGT